MLDLDLGISEELKSVDEWICDSIDCGIETIEKVGRYVLDAGGKRIRPIVVLLSFKALNGDDARMVVPIAATMEIIHTGTIIHDDINDHSVLRRGIPTAYRKYGTTNALLTGDYFFVKAFEAVSEYDKKIRDVVINSCVLLAQGEVVQSQTTGDISLSEEEYMDIIEKKTASPISAGAKVGGIIAGGSDSETDKLEKYGLNLGIGFQIMDDVLDVIGVDKETGKYKGNDIHEGKITILAIHALDNSSLSNRKKLEELLRKKNKDDNDISEAIDIMKETGSVEYARDLGRKYITDAKDSIADLPDSPWKENLVRLADFVVERKY